MCLSLLKRVTAMCLCFCLTMGLSGCGSGAAARSTQPIPPKPEPSSKASDNSSPQSGEAPHVQEKTEEKPVSSPPKDDDLTDTSYLDLTEFLKENGYICAVAFIGHASGPKWEGSYHGIYGDQGHLIDYPFISKIPDERFVEYEGEELYCIVPADQSATVAVNQWIIPEGSGQQGYAGEVLYRSESGEPILLRGNADSLASNLRVTITDENGRSATLFPMTNSMDGTLLLAELSDVIWDFTLYDDPLYGGPIDTEKTLTMEELLGDWSVWGLVDEAGNPISCHLSFRSDFYSGDDMELLICDGDENVVRRYEGSYYGPDDAHQDPTPELMRFELMLTQGEGADKIPPPMIVGMFSIFPAPSADGIIVAHQEGDPLLPGMEHSWIGFLRAQG